MQVTLDDLDIVLDVLDALEGDGAGTAYHADDPVAFSQKQLCQVRPILAGNSGDQCSRHIGLLRFQYSTTEL